MIQDVDIGIGYGERHRDIRGSTQLNVNTEERSSRSLYKTSRPI